MTDIDQRPARIVYDLEDQVLPQPAAGPLYIEDFLALAASLRAAGYPVGDEVERVEAINAAVDAMLAAEQTGHWLADIDLMTADPEDIANRVRQAGIDRAAQLELFNQRNGFQHRLARAAADSLQANSDAVVKAMRKRFDPAVKVVQAAAERGLTQHTNMAELVDLAAPEVIEAYRALGPAVAELNAVAVLRNQLTTVARVGPTQHLMAAFITDVDNTADLEGAHNIWTGESEIVQHDLPFLGTHLARVRKQRLGGAWLALVCAGYTLRLNTGDEAAAVVRAARDGGA